MTGDAGAEAALALMVGGGVPAALITDGVGYLGGAVTRWIGIQATHLARRSPPVCRLQGWSAMGWPCS